MTEEDSKTEIGDNDDEEYCGLPYRLWGFLILFPTLILCLLWDKWGVFTLQSLFLIFIIGSIIVTCSVYFGSKVYKTYIFRFKKK